ncbi:hypothetical protein, partial [Atlantibacter hermannii]
TLNLFFNGYHPQPGMVEEPASVSGKSVRTVRMWLLLRKVKKDRESGE